ncbi:MAG: DUF4013 domain-containing protein [Patescibacteria group bacterium]
MNQQPITFSAALSYPFNRAKGMLNILWVLVPIVGWFLIGGYGVRIVKEFIKGEYKQLPELDFGRDIELGFFMFLKALPFILAYMTVFGIFGWMVGAVMGDESAWFASFVEVIVSLLVFPMLFMHFMKKETVGSLFEFSVIKPVFANFGDYVTMLLKSFGLAIIFGLLSLVLVGIPASAFTKNIFAADFYRRNSA